MSTLAALIVLLPWLRAIPRLGPLPSVPWPMVAGAALTLAAAVGLYVRIGRPDATAIAYGPAGMLMPPMSAVPEGGGANAQAGSRLGNTGGSMDAAIATLRARLANGGGTADDWELLAKSYEFLGRPADAANARARQLPTVAFGSAAVDTAAARAIAPPILSAQSLQRLAEANAARRTKKYTDAAGIYRELAASGQLNADGWADYADTTATVQGNKLAGEPEAYIAHALAIDPQHPKALWLQASADEETGRWGDAVRVWRQLSAHLDAGSADAKIVAANLQQDLGLAGPASAAAAPVAPATGAAVVSGEVTLADALRARASGQATLFIVAKSVDSPGAPLAVLRTSADTWPVKFTLDDSQAMLPGRNLSSVSRVTVEARISVSGQATPASGDLEGTSPIIDPSAHQPLKILINQVIQ